MDKEDKANDNDMTNNSHSARTRRYFLIAYITSILSVLSLLSGSIFFGYALLNHWLAPENNSFIDLAPLYLSVITSMLVFTALYIATSQFVARTTALREVNKSDWRTYKVIYSIFAALLIVISTSVIASLLYVPLSKLFVTSDMANYEIIIQVVGGLHALLWIGLFVWQEHLTKRGSEKRVLIQGGVIALLAATIIVLSGVFLIGSKTNERQDARTSSDLSVIESAITSYKSSHKNDLPKSLEKINLKDYPTTKKRLGDYEYTINKQPLSERTDETQGQDSDYLSTSNSLSGVSSSSTSYMPILTETYQLCASFLTDTTDQEPVSILKSLTDPTKNYTSQQSFTVHKDGHQCFDRR